MIAKPVVANSPFGVGPNQVFSGLTLGQKIEKILGFLLVALLLLILLAYAVVFAWHNFVFVTYPYPIQYGEGTVFYEAAQVAKGQPLYTNNLNPPYEMVNYGPLGYYVYALTLLKARFFGLVGGRLLSSLATLGSCFCLYLASRPRLNRVLAIAASLTPLATGPVFGNSSLYKPDMLATALSLAAVTLIYRKFVLVAEAKSLIAFSQYRFVYLAAALCLLAIGMKQSALAAPVAIFLYLLLQSRPAAVRFGLALTGLALVVFGLFQFTSGGLFWTHFATYNAQLFQIARLKVWLTYLFEDYWLLLVLSAVYIGWHLVVNKGWQNRLSLWGLYWIVAFVVTLSIGKVGANWNYYIELMFISSFLSWSLVGAFLNRQYGFKIIGWQVPFGNIVLVLLLLQLIGLRTMPSSNDWRTPQPNQAAQDEQIKALVNAYASKGPILLEDVGWLQANQYSTDMDDAFAFRQLFEQGQWSETRILEDLKAGHYKTIVLQMWGVNNLDDKELGKRATRGEWQVQPDRFTPEMIKYFHKFFKTDRNIGNIVFLTWND